MYDHMAPQFEDCVDAIQVLFPNYDSIKLFDRSCGHDRGCPDGLEVGNMQTLWGGKQSHVRDTKIECEEGFLGPFSPKLHVGDIQSMTFSENDEGPFYLPPVNCKLWRYDEIRRKKTKNRLKKDLCKELECLRVNTRGKH
jgi:hypothetical protein